MRSVQLVIRLKLQKPVVKIYPEYVSAGLVDAVGHVSYKLRIRRDLKMLANADSAADILEIIMINIPGSLAGVQIFLFARSLIFLKERADTGKQIVMRTIEGKAVYAFGNALFQKVHPPFQIIIFHSGDNIFRHSGGTMIYHRAGYAALNGHAVHKHIGQILFG